MEALGSLQIDVIRDLLLPIALSIIAAIIYKYLLYWLSLFTTQGKYLYLLYRLKRLYKLAYAQKRGMIGSMIAMRCLYVLMFMIGASLLVIFQIQYLTVDIILTLLSDGNLAEYYAHYLAMAFLCMSIANFLIAEELMRFGLTGEFTVEKTLTDAAQSRNRFSLKRQQKLDRYYTLLQHMYVANDR